MATADPPAPTEHIGSERAHARGLPAMLQLCSPSMSRPAQIKEKLDGMHGASFKGAPIKAYNRVAVKAAPAGCDGWTRYVRLFSPEYHAAPVVVTPEEAGLVSLRAEVLDSLGVALPVLAFWVSVSLSFVAYGSLAGSSPG